MLLPTAKIVVVVLFFASKIDDKTFVGVNHFSPPTPSKCPDLPAATCCPAPIGHPCK